MFLFSANNYAQPIANYVGNGSLEEYYDCSSTALQKAKYWTGIDSLCFGGPWLGVCNGQVPKGLGTIYQYPHSGEAYVSTVFYCPPWALRTYVKNRLKSTLQAGKTYCVKFYVNIENGSSHGIDGFGAYFGDNQIDTITQCNAALSYIAPQVQNPQGNIITDTLNWIAITGTFTANGTEKFLLLGNFLSDNNTDTLMINPATLPTIYTGVNIDDVSCIEVDLPAYAGRDTTIYLGDSTYIGREKDFAIDNGCVWYKLPNTTAIDTISGMWVKPPIGTHTYVVRQELECSALKWDTVVVTVREYDVGINEFTIENLQLTIYPNPAGGMLNVELKMLNKEAEVQIINVLGELIKHSTLTTKHSQIDVSELEKGIYFIKVGNAARKFVKE